MAGRRRTRKNNDSQKTYKDVDTQTTPEKSIAEINRLKEEVNLLRQELDQLKQKQPLNSTDQKQKEEVTVVAVADCQQAQKYPLKGCNCRGKCANKICGCVKKQVACTAACKCQHAKCENQESDKENIGSASTAQVQTSSDIENSTNLLAALKMKKNLPKQSAEEAAGPTKNHATKVIKSGRSVFSPDTPETLGESISKLQLHTPIRFNGSKKAILYDSDSSPEEKRKPKLKSGKNRLELPVEKTRERSKSNESQNKRLISPYYAGRKARAASFEIQDILGFDSSAEEEEKANKMDKVGTGIATSSSGNLEQLLDQDNFSAEKFETIDPMKPTRQLQRTPVLATPNKKSLSRSKSPLAYPEEPPKAVKKSIVVPPPKDIDAPQVDWEEHCAQLVPCRLCNRTFYPFRLEKHEASCKKI